MCKGKKKLRNSSYNGKSQEWLSVSNTLIKLLHDLVSWIAIVSWEELYSAII